MAKKTVRLTLVSKNGLCANGRSTRLGIVGQTGTRVVECERRYASPAAVLLLLLPLPCLLLLQQLLLLLLVGARQSSGSVQIVRVANLSMDKTKARVRAIIETWEHMIQTRWRRTQWQQRACMQAVQRHVMGSNAVQSLTELLIYRQIAYRARLTNHLWCRCRLLMHIEELLGDFKRAELIASKESFVLKSMATRL